MEFNERISIENYSYTGRSGSNSCGNIIRTIMIGLFFFVVLVFVLISSQKFVKEFQEESDNQQIRHLEMIEKDLHLEYFYNKLNISKDEVKLLTPYLNEEINQERINKIDHETDIPISDSFFTNRTNMPKNLHLIKSKSNNISLFANKNNNFSKNSFLHRQNQEENLIFNTNNKNNKSSFDDHFNANKNISNIYFNYVNKQKEEKWQNLILTELSRLLESKQRYLEINKTNSTLFMLYLVNISKKFDLDAIRKYNKFSNIDDEMESIYHSIQNNNVYYNNSSFYKKPLSLITQLSSRKVRLTNNRGIILRSLLGKL